MLHPGLSTQVTRRHACSHGTVIILRPFRFIVLVLASGCAAASGPGPEPVRGHRSEPTGASPTGCELQLTTLVQHGSTATVALDDDVHFELQVKNLTSTPQELVYGRGCPGSDTMVTGFPGSFDPTDSCAAGMCMEEPKPGRLQLAPGETKTVEVLQGPVGPRGGCGDPVPRGSYRIEMTAGVMSKQRTCSVSARLSVQ